MVIAFQKEKQKNYFRTFFKKSNIMQKQPTYTYQEFMQHIKICDAETVMILLDLICEEVRFYTRAQALNIYENLHSKFITHVKKL